MGLLLAALFLPLAGRAKMLACVGPSGQRAHPLHGVDIAGL